MCLFTAYPNQKLKVPILQSPATKRVDLLLKLCVEVAVRISAGMSDILIEVSVCLFQSLYGNAHAETPAFHNHIKTFPLSSFTSLITIRLHVF
jgi:hypothetical protein